MRGEMYLPNTSGHSVVEWDTEKPESVAAAKDEFDYALRYGGFAYGESATKDREQMREFDETMPRVVIAPRIAGGC